MENKIINEFKEGLKRLNEILQEMKKSGGKISTEITEKIKTSIEKHKNTFIKKGVPVALAIALTLPLLTACDEFGNPTHGHKPPKETTDVTETGDFSDSTIEEVTGDENAESDADFDLGPMLDQIDFVDLLTSTEGQECTDAMYERFLNSVADEPGQLRYSGEIGNYLRVLTSEVGEKRHNVMLEIKNVDNNRWSYVLVSTKDDFAVVARDSKKHNDYIVGFMDGKVVDQAGYLNQTARAMINGMIMAEGYEATMNQVRDEFFGQLLALRTSGNEDYMLPILGKIHNVRNEDRDLNPVEERDYIIEQIQVVSAFDAEEIYTTMDATYDIPDNYLGTQLGNQNNGGHGGREAN